jgi:uncharacterized zinc-type alcohol dehydrogenase-like protein
MSADHKTFKAFATLKPKEKLVPFEYVPRPLGDDDVEVQITHSGVCASDLHQSDDGWGGSVYPMVPGHEIIGKVTAVGKRVTNFKVGERAGVGTVVLSCQSCKDCKNSDEQMCAKTVFTYNAKYPGGELAFGGYASHVRVHQHYVFHIPEALSSAGAAPLLCAGITTYTPYKTHNISKGKRVGVVGVGGLGHLGIKWGVAFGCHVTAISHNENKRDESKKLGAHGYLNSDDEYALKAAANSFDFILITANPKDEDYTKYLKLADSYGVICNVGFPESDIKFKPGPLLMKSVSFSGSVTGGMKITQEMLDFAAKHKIEADVQLFPVKQVNEAWDGVRNGKPRFRYVLDTSSGFDVEGHKAVHFDQNTGKTQ